MCVCVCVCVCRMDNAKLFERIEPIGSKKCKQTAATAVKINTLKIPLANLVRLVAERSET